MDLNILESFSKYLQQSNIGNDVIRFIGWWIIKILYSICSLVEATFSEMFKWLNFGFIDSIEHFFSNSEMRLLLIAVTTLALTFFALMMLVDRKAHDIKGLPKNFFVLLVTAVGLPTLMGIGNQMILDFNEAIGVGDGLITAEILTDNFYDVKYIDHVLNFNGTKLDSDQTLKSTTNFIEGKSNVTRIIDSLDINKKIKFNDEEMTRSLYKYKLIYDDSGVAVLSEIKSAKGELMGAVLWDFTNYYYQYNYNFLPICISYVGVAIAMTMATYKVVRIGFELAGQKLIAPFLAGADIGKGQKIKKVLNNIAMSYFVLCYVTLSIKLLFFGIGYATQTFNLIGSAISIFFICLATIDGPNYIERILGIDAGLGKGAWFSMYHGAKVATNVVKSGLSGGIKTIDSGIRGGTDAYERAKGWWDGFKDEMKQGGTIPKDKSDMPNGKTQSGDDENRGVSSQDGQDSRSPFTTEEDSIYDNPNVDLPKDMFPSAFDDEPTEKQLYAAQKLGIPEEELEGKSKGQVSQMLQNAGAEKSYWDGVNAEGRNLDENNGTYSDEDYAKENAYNAMIDDDSKIGDSGTYSDEDYARENAYNAIIDDDSGQYVSDGDSTNSRYGTGYDDISQGVDDHPLNMNKGGVIGKDSSGKNPQAGISPETVEFNNSNDSIDASSHQGSSTGSERKPQPGLASETINFEKSGGSVKGKPKEDTSEGAFSKSQFSEKDLRDATKIERMKVGLTRKGVDTKGRQTMDNPLEKRKKIKASNTKIGENRGRLLANRIKRIRKK